MGKHYDQLDLDDRIEISRLHAGGISRRARSIPYSPSVAWDDVAFASAKWIGTSDKTKERIGPATPI